jgi:hypothetical protein
VTVRVPQNGYINYSGDDWSCEDGFRKNEDACVASSDTNAARSPNSK